MPRRFSEVIATTKAYSSGNATPLELAPRPYVITAMVLDFELNVDTSGTPGTTQDAYYRILSSLNLQGDKGRSYVSLQDLRPMHFENKLFLPGKSKFVTQTTPGTSADDATRRAQLWLHFGVRPVSPDGTYNPFDLTAGIPADESTLVLTPTWAAATNLGSGWTINASTLMRVTLFGVQARKGENIRPAMVPAFQDVRVTPSGTGGSLGEPYNVPTSHFWHSSTILSLAGSSPADNRSRTALADIGLKVASDGNAQIAKFDWDSFEYITGRETAIAEDDGTTFLTPVVTGSGDAGVGRLDLTTLGGQVNQLYGLDLRSAHVGDVVINFGVTTVGKVAFLHRMYDPAA